MIGRIQAIDGKTITVQEGRPEAACFACLSQECGTRDRTRLFTVENTLNLSLSVGQFVETGAPKRGFTRQALLALLLPAVAFGVGFALVGACFAGVGEGAQAAGGAACLFIVAGLTYLVRAHIPVKNKPLVSRVLIADEPSFHFKSV
ncbi:MAG: SoxR reducing system RseC family protein [Treponema sp.]|jgi:positive regulator of sigma E activity|nr:SoxR reducing system RseC family protein [Treponema sp.]